MLAPIVNKTRLEGRSLTSSPSPTLPTATPNPQTPLPSINSLNKSANSSANRQEFSYPNAKVISSDKNSVILESTDSVNTITNWYKKQIQSQGLKTTSFIETNTNGEILNQLVGTNGTDKIQVSISKTAANQLARIELRFNE